MLLSIEAEWESLASGPPEDRACFAALGIRYDGIWLTQAEDSLVKRIREKVHLRGDYSSESIEDTAAQFMVSPLAVRTSLVNHGRLDSAELEVDFETAAAA